MVISPRECTELGDFVETDAQLFYMLAQRSVNVQFANEGRRPGIDSTPRIEEELKNEFTLLFRR